MNILFVTSECAPFSKSGGLADVAFSLPPALQKAGDKVEIIVPYYKMTSDRFADEIEFVKNCECRLGDQLIKYSLRRGELSGVTVWFIEHENFFHRPKLYGYGDDSLRFAFFSRAVVDLIGQLTFVPDILHCNDWESALAVIYLKNDTVWREELRAIKSVYTIHNMAYQGQFGRNELTGTFALPEGWYDGGLGFEFEGRQDINLMKGAMLMADAVSTVSPTYARELHLPYFANNLQGVVDMVSNKLYGILNGIDMDHYDPTKDARIPAHFTHTDLAGKAKCKLEIQRLFGLDEEPEWPLLSVVARLNEQKGVELIKDILPRLMEMGVQLIVFGQGEDKYVEYFNWAKQNWPGQLGFSSDYTELVAAKIFAGADMYLMPSRFEPCGLSQMMAMRYGTVPIVHETGGLKDSVRAFKEFDGIGDGFAFMDYSSDALYLAIREAVKLYFSDEEMFDKLRKRCMTKDFSWDKSAQQYQQMYSDICGAAGQGDPITFEQAFGDIRHAYVNNYNFVFDRAQKDKEDREKLAGYKRVVQFRILGRGEGVFHIRFENGELQVVPTPADDAEAWIECSYDNLYDIGRGLVTMEKLYMNGHLRFTGNLSKGFEIRRLIAPPRGK